MRGYATAHAYRHIVASHRLDDGYEFRTVDAHLRINDTSAEMPYTHVVTCAWGAFRGSVDRLESRPVHNPLSRSR